MKILCHYILITMVLSLVSGCALTTVVGGCSAWQKDDLVLEGTYGIGYGRTYTVLYVGDAKKYADRLPYIFIESLSGEKILLSTITVSMLENTKGIILGPGWWLGASWVSTDWPEKTKVCGWGGYIFIILDDRIVGFQAFGLSGLMSEAPRSGFWDKTLTKHYEFPIKHKDAVELFGAPDDITEFVCK